MIVLGDCNPDLVLRGDVRPRFGEVETLVADASLTVGGSAAITACGLVRLGVDCRLAAAVGDDDLGRTQVAALREAGVDTSAVVVDPALPTGVSVILNEADDRAILTARGAIGALTASDVALPEGIEHVHVSALFLLSGLRPGLPALLRGARDAGARVSLDTNWDPSGSWSKGLEPILEQVDVLLPNLEEARRLSGREAPEEAAAALAERVPTVVVKLGAEGAIAVSGDERARAAAPRIDVVDTIGAGDGFNAGFIAGRVAGRSLADALELAAVCGALSAAGRGGTAGQPTLDEAEAALARPG